MAYLTAFFQEHLVVLAESHAKYNRCYVFEAVYPFLPFTSLAPHIEHAARRVSHSTIPRFNRV